MGTEAGVAVGHVLHKICTHSEHGAKHGLTYDCVNMELMPDMACKASHIGDVVTAGLSAGFLSLGCIVAVAACLTWMCVWGNL